MFDELTSEPGVSPARVEQVLGAILEGRWTPVQVAGFAVALRLRGETPETIAAAARALRRAARPVAHRYAAVLDTCGTGGDGAGTLNLSTGAALIAAAAGVAVAKHGNRAVSSRAGSADVLAALGIPLDLAPAGAGAVLDEVGITFLMAPIHHPALRHGGVARRELGIRTIFNCLGPLANPAGATHQLVGAYDDALRPTLARTLRDLGLTRAWVVRGEDGLDEISPSAPTRVTELSGGALTERVVAPEDFGLQRLDPGAYAGGDANENARALERVLANEPHPARDAVLLNAAAALVVARGVEPREAARTAAEQLTSGRAAALLAEWRAAAQRAEREPGP
ncbi:MAG: anthranilate phosphoribosyltransferase [Polyangiaceae bacterium]|nr:anthranilate phosphoribosyltransferase [Polyangiaceae bacterium]